MAKENYNKGATMIGIMADSHGQPETIAAALGVLTDRDCRLIYHLDDGCDSTHSETAEACLVPLRDPRVIRRLNCRLRQNFLENFTISC